VAVSLDFAVRLEVEQPEPALIEELVAALEFYLRQPTVAQPIEFFHGMLLGFYHGDPLPLWIVRWTRIPSMLRHVADDGAESRYGRLAGSGDPAVAPEAGLEVWIERVLATSGGLPALRVFAELRWLFQMAAPGLRLRRGEAAVRTVARWRPLELRRDLDTAPT
jgi:hypothetical protein